MMLALWFTLTFTSSAVVLLCLIKVSLKGHLERPEVCFGQVRLYIHLKRLGCCLSRERTNELLFCCGFP